MAYGLGLFGTTYLIPVFVQDVAGYSPSRAGDLLIVPGLGLAVTIALAGRWTDRVEPRRIVIAGLALFALSSLLLAFAGRSTGFVVLGALAADRPHRPGHDHSGAFGGAVQALDESYIAYAASAVNFVRQLGGAIGVNLLAVAARMAAGRAWRGRCGNGLSRMLLGGYDCVCGRDCGRLVDPQASTGQR